MMAARLSPRQLEALQTIGAYSGPTECCGKIENVKYLISNHFGWTMFDTYSQRDRFFKNLEARGFIKLSGTGNSFAELTDAGRKAIEAKP